MHRDIIFFGHDLRHFKHAFIKKCLLCSSWYRFHVALSAGEKACFFLQLNTPAQLKALIQREYITHLYRQLTLKGKLKIFSGQITYYHKCRCQKRCTKSLSSPIKWPYHYISHCFNFGNDHYFGERSFSTTFPQPYTFWKYK